jgi:hypothetical protein
MNKTILILVMAMVSMFVLSSCGWETYLEEETNQAVETANKTGLSSAVVYQTQFAIDGLERVMKDADPTNLTPTIEKIKYEWVTITNIVSLAEWEGTPDIAVKFKEIDTRLKGLTSKPDISPADFVTGVRDVIASLQDLLKIVFIL